MLLALFAVKSLSVLIYCGFLYAACGILFPLPIAILLSIAGCAIISSIPYWLGKRLGSQAAQRISRRYSKAAYLHDLRSGNDFFFCLNCPTAWNSPRRCGQRIYGCRQCEIPELSASMLTGFFADLYSFPHYGDEHFGYEFLAISYFGRHQIGLCACFLHCFSYLPQKAPCHDRVIVDPQRQRSVADSSNLIPSSGSARRWRSASVRSLRTRNRDRGERCGKL